jgi:hypothetical protein
MFIKSFYIFFFLVFFTDSFAAIDKENSIVVDDTLQVCESTKEYITTLNFLRKSDKYQIKEADARKIAIQISKGCSGAAQRFINIVSLLSNASVDTSSSIKIAREVALKGEKVNRAFIGVFRRSYRSSDFDLSAKDSLQLARELSLDFKGDIGVSITNFDKFSEFCLSYKGLDLPKKECANMVKELVQVGDSFRVPIAPAYMEIFNFLVDRDEVNLPLYKALKLSKQTITYGPTAVKNFKDAYHFAIHQKGLNKGRKQAISFALLMAKNSLKSKTNK